MRLGSRISTAVILLFALFSESLQQLEAVSGRTLPTRVPRNQVGAGAIHSSSKRPTLLTYHGFVEDAQGPQPVILHVLVKAKRLPDGSFSVRAVSYAERVVLQSEWQNCNRTLWLKGYLFLDSNVTCTQCSMIA